MQHASEVKATGEHFSPGFQSPFRRVLSVVFIHPLRVKPLHSIDKLLCLWAKPFSPYMFCSTLQELHTGNLSVFQMESPGVAPVKMGTLRAKA